MTMEIPLGSEVKFYGQLPHVGASRVIGIRADQIEIELWSGEHRWIPRARVITRASADWKLTPGD